MIRIAFIHFKNPNIKQWKSDTKYLFFLLRVVQSKKVQDFFCLKKEKSSGQTFFQHFIVIATGT